MKSAHLTLLGLSLALTGCQMLSYQEPASGATATVVFSSDNVAVQPVVCVPGKGFKSTEYAVAQKPFKSEFFDQLNDSLKKKEQVEVKVPATGDRIRIGFVLQRKQDNGTYHRCKVAADFGITANATYQAHFVESGDHCGLTVKQDGQPLNDQFLAPWECQ